MKLLLLGLTLSLNCTVAWSAFDCTELKNKDEMMACLKDLRLLEDKYAVKDACAKIKNKEERKLCEAVETKKDACYGYKKYGTQEGSQYEKCFIGKESVIKDSKREPKEIEKFDSAPVKKNVNSMSR